jgi:multicomponent K+:H+ antiporter subunit E
MMRRVLPWPVMSAFLLFMWLLLNQTIAPAHILLGAVLAIALPLLSLTMRPTAVRMRHPLRAVRLAGVVAWDSLLSNIAVARVILGSHEKRNNSGFMKIPLDLRDPHGLAVLAMILTAVPGTVWSELSDDRSTLTIHVLDLSDEDFWIRTIKTRYEQPLMEIFE